MDQALVTLQNQLPDGVHVFYTSDFCYKVRTVLLVCLSRPTVWLSRWVLQTRPAPEWQRLVDFFLLVSMNTLQQSADLLH